MPYRGTVGEVVTYIITLNLHISICFKGFLVTGKSHLRGESIGKAVRRSDEKVFNAVKLKHFTPHDLRRTAATHMTEMCIEQDT